MVCRISAAAGPRSLLRWPEPALLIHPPLDEQADVPRLVDLRVVSVAEHDRVASCAGRVFDAARDRREEGVANVGDDEGDRLGPHRTQLPGQYVGHVAQLHDRPGHASARVLADGPGPVDHARHGHGGDAGPTSHVAQSGHRRTVLDQTGRRSLAGNRPVAAHAPPPMSPGSDRDESALSLQGWLPGTRVMFRGLHTSARKPRRKAPRVCRGLISIWPHIAGIKAPAFRHAATDRVHGRPPAFHSFQLSTQDRRLMSARAFSGVDDRRRMATLRLAGNDTGNDFAPGLQVARAWVSGVGQIALLSPSRATIAGRPNAGILVS